MAVRRVALTIITGVHKPITGRPPDEIRTSRNQILDITETVRELGLDPNGDIIFNGSNAVAVEKWSQRTPYNKTDLPIIVLKTTNEADLLIEHELLVTGVSNKGKQTTINLKVIVE